MSIPPWRASQANYANNQNAYSVVTPRTTVSRPAYGLGSHNVNTHMGSNMMATPAPATTTTTEWPDAVKKFVTRCFAEVRPEDRSTMEGQLKDVITQAYNHNTTWSIDWNQQSLPILLQRRFERESQSQLPTQLASLSIPVSASGPLSKKRGRSFEIASPNDTNHDTNKNQNNNKNKKSKTKSKKDKQSAFRGNDAEIFSSEKQEQRRKRFETNRPTNIYDINDADPDSPFIGRSTTLEKRYLRLTSAPDPANVRPLHILKQTLDLLKRKWKEEQNYAYICDQFKSMRQDLTVQHISNEFTIAVYEIHARIALEKGDLGEYNQCQTQLKTLYANKDLESYGHPLEFLAYRILYMVHTQNHAEIAELMIQMNYEDDLLTRGENEGSDSKLTDAQRARRYHKTNPAIQHALQVQTAVSTNNYHKLFKLYNDAPNMGGYVMDSFIDRERVSALTFMSRAYRPELPLSFVIDTLTFEDMQEGCEFLEKYDVAKFVIKKELSSQSTSEGESQPENTVACSYYLDTKNAYPYLEVAKRNVFKKVDIKGQI
ncbi:hypothetical protein NADFUDRAFT_53183 [Nadsonia fulvescens var. elongata DSM 6958]|uniref:SAC3/GANP/THP3 conserved domain-containing protein n=1 Tax=Nadsonia fulvescens var. elongata DSM 6958 TaxID=857566 RepID=A0A1E3PDM3_9ASCO|nr:hypothetical protein NADFUDRAFT_53183 [Nadsonia fulvescens var. elongata DSM 6958]